MTPSLKRLANWRLGRLLADDGREDDDDEPPPLLLWLLLLLLLFPCLEEVTSAKGRFELELLKEDNAGPGLFRGDEPGGKFNK